MDDMKLESLKARIERSEYAVDPKAVAEAILRRMAARHDLAPVAAAGRDAVSPSGGLSLDDALEVG